jgi:hypothetical protein
MTTTMPLELPDQEVVGMRIRGLRISLAIGIAVDLLGAVAMRYLPGQMAEMMGVSPPVDNDFWPRYSAVFLVVVPMFYAIAWLNPVRYIANAAGAVVARILGFGFYFKYFSLNDSRKAFLFLALMNLALAAAHYWLLGGRAGWSRAWASLRLPHRSR